MIQSNTSARLVSAINASTIAIAYAVAGSLWVFFSDRALHIMVGHRPELLSEAQTIKGWVFIVVTAGALYAIMRTAWRDRQGRSAAAVDDERFSALVESLPDYAVAILASDGRVESWSSGAVQITGYRAAEAVGQPLARFLAPDDFPRGDPARMLASAAAHGSLASQSWHLRKDGTRYRARSVTTALHGRDGLPAGFVHVTRDMTERHRAEEGLRESERRLRDFTSAGSDWFWETDAALRLTYASERFETMAGLGRDQWLGKRRDELPIAADDPAGTERLMEHMRARRSFRNLEYSFLDARKRRRTVLSSAKPVYDESGAFAGYRGAAIDVTAVKVAEAQLHQAQKMEAVGQLTGGVAHDFNNLLSIILGSVELLDEQMPPDSRLHELSQEALTACRRGAELTQRLLAFARRQPLAPAVTDLNDLVGGLAPLLRRTLGATIRVETALSAGLWPTLIDPGLIENALFNLALNARDAMPAGGILTIETRNTRLGEEYAAEHADVVPGAYVMVAVSDTGVGMPREVAERASEPFFTTKQAGKGSGLGLSMVYGLVRQSGGHIRIYSEPERGTTVRLYLPFTEASGAATERERDRDAGPEPEGAGETVLVVEDDEAVRRAATRVLARLGYRFLEATAASAALELFAGTDAIDLVLTDMVLPDGMSGADLVRALRAKRPHLPVVFMSGYTENTLREATDGEEFVAKPFTRGDLARALHRALAAGRQAAAQRRNEVGAHHGQ